MKLIISKNYIKKVLKRLFSIENILLIILFLLCYFAGYESGVKTFINTTASQFCKDYVFRIK